MSNLPPLPDPEKIPAVPSGVAALPGTDRQSLLKVPADQRAEVDQAMEQVWNRRAELSADLGTLAPDAQAGKVLHDRMHEARKVNARAQALAAFTQDQELLAGHDVMNYLNGVADDVEHLLPKTPQLAERYDKVLTVVRQRREAIAAGMARAKTAKSSDPVTQ
jgi:hypothetical protein